MKAQTIALAGVVLVAVVVRNRPAAPDLAVVEQTLAELESEVEN